MVCFKYIIMLSYRHTSHVILIMDYCGILNEMMHYLVSYHNFYYVDYMYLHKVAHMTATPRSLKLGLYRIRDGWVRHSAFVNPAGQLLLTRSVNNSCIAFSSGEFYIVRL